MGHGYILEKVKLDKTEKHELQIKVWLDTTDFSKLPSFTLMTIIFHSALKHYTKNII